MGRCALFFDIIVKESGGCSVLQCTFDLLQNSSMSMGRELCEATQNQLHPPLQKDPCPDEQGFLLPKSYNVRNKPGTQLPRQGQNMNKICQNMAKIPPRKGRSTLFGHIVHMFALYVGVVTPKDSQMHGKQGSLILGLSLARTWRRLAIKRLTCRT